MELEDWQKHLIVWGIVSVVEIGLFCLCFFVKGIYSVYGWEDAFFISGVVMVLVGLLILVTFYGAFDIFIYGFSSVFSHMNPNPEHVRKDKDYYSYIQRRQLEREDKKPYLWPYFIEGGVCLLVWLILALVSQSL